VALESLLADFFGVPAAIEQFVGGWYPLEVAAQCALGEEDGASSQLGLGAVAGDEVWDQQSRARIRLGPLTRAQYDALLPNGSAHAELRSLVHFFGGGEIDFELQLVLARDEVPAVALGVDGDDAPPLAWCTWLGPSRLRRDPDDTVLTL
jgi:type VI secretion system protein ImpH